jgi:cupin 2 domain-containing protein
MTDNLFADLLRSTGNNEQFSNLLNRPGLRIERIISTGQSSPEGFWYDQPEGEWVVLLQGQATLRFEDSPAPFPMTPGDFINIAPHRRHRVDSTHPDQPTVWLAIHYAAA